MSDSFIREVDEDLRQEQLQNLWSKYGKLVIGIAVGIVLIVIGRSSYNYFNETKYAEQAEAFSAALKQEESQVNAALDPIISGDVDGYKILASFKKAELAQTNGNDAEALAILDNFAKTADVPQVYKDVANIKAAILSIDTATPEDIKARLSLMLNSEGGFSDLAQELIALSELKAGNTEEAKSMLQKLYESANVAPSIKSRAEQYLAVIN